MGVFPETRSNGPLSQKGLQSCSLCTPNINYAQRAAQLDVPGESCLRNPLRKICTVAQPPPGYQPLPGDLRHCVRKLGAASF
jgi:hypothetical protein